MAIQTDEGLFGKKTPTIKKGTSGSAKGVTRVSTMPSGAATSVAKTTVQPQPTVSGAATSLAKGVTTPSPTVSAGITGSATGVLPSTEDRWATASLGGLEGVTTGTSTPKKTSSGGGSGGYGGGYTPEVPSNQSYLDLLEKQKQAEIDALNAALEKNKGMYNTQLADLDNQYKALINQSELNRYKGKSSIREALANRGQLDSGYGRQEALNESLNYGNQVNNIRISQEKSKQDIKNAINSLQADYQKDLAELEAKYNNLILQAQNQ